MSTIDYSEKIPNNVNLADDRTLKRALEQWQPNFISWWDDVGPETMESRIFGRLTAWQNWIFVRPNAAGPEGALRRYGTGRRAEFDRRRV